MVSSKLDWIEDTDEIVVFAFNMGVENNLQSIDDTDTLEDIVSGGTDAQIQKFMLLTIHEKQRVLERVNGLLSAYHEGKKFEECSFCNKRSIVSVVITDGEKAKSFEMCEEHLSQHANNPEESIKKMIEMIELEDKGGGHNA